MELQDGIKSRVAIFQCDEIQLPHGRKELAQVLPLFAPVALYKGGAVTASQIDFSLKKSSSKMQLGVPILLALSATISSSLNAIVLYVFAKLGVKKITFKDVFMLSMTVGDLLQSILGYSLEIYSMGEREGGKRKSEIGLKFCKVM